MPRGREPPPSGRSTCTSGKVLRHLPRRRAAFSASATRRPPRLHPKRRASSRTTRAYEWSDRLDGCYRSRGLGRGRAAVRTRVSVESRRKIVGFTTLDLPSGEWPREVRRYREIGHGAAPSRGCRRARRAPGSHPTGSGHCTTRALGRRTTSCSSCSASTRTVESRCRCGSTSKTSTPRSPNSTPRTPDSRSERPRRPLENAASRVSDRINELFAGRRWDEIGALFADVNLWVRRPAAGLAPREQRPRHGGR